MLKNRMVIEAAGEAITSVNAAVNMNKLLQISCGAVYSDAGETLEFDISKRYSVLKEVIEESSQKVLVFVPFKHVINILSEKLNADGITTEVIYGDVSAAKRTDIFNRFQTDPVGTKVLVIQPQAAAHGVTLTAANTVVWWGPTSSLETYAQANARVHRSGQRHPSTVVQLVGSNMERHVYKLLDSKIDVHSKIVELYSELLA
jgi:SNF2 family DNA or RNA helicase